MKKTFATIALTLTVLFGATFVQAGIIVTDNTPTCTDDGIISQLMGIIVTDFTGGSQCTANTGILVSD